MSKFKGILNAAKGREPEPEPEPEPQPTVDDSQKQSLVETAQPTKKTKPPGKRSHPDFEQVSAYIRKDTHKKVKMKLLSDGNNKDFSDLVEQLLSDWVQQ
ncbi:hypothetical protein F7734_09930 [Scytonema sp. UIC 10036]|uniref:hypothetical protein n=1 Tax=Scytonema sp. UIC 10036 TaxID=2304196 RepID=UPI001385212F|nr:hypothetical protein [Scytonema sp. UIC 10036]MUG92750.1 hypothetical protein [Scytonema sp. UIC 10036]